METYLSWIPHDHIVGVIDSAVNNYHASMLLVFKNTYKEIYKQFPMLNQYIYLMIVGFIGLFGLVITFYLLFVAGKFLKRIFFGRHQSQTFSQRFDDNDDRHDRQPDPNVLESHRWLRQAHCDLKAARNDFSGDYTSPEWVCYKCQQALEKALKAVLISSGRSSIPERLSHDLSDVVRKTKDRGLIERVDSIQNLTGLISGLRYPDFHPYPKIPHDMYSLEKALKVHELTTAVFKDIVKMVKRQS